MAHLVRRGAVYHWRRRFGGPALGCPARVVTLSLSTKEKALARRRGAELTHMSETLSEEVRQRRLTGEEARAMLVAVARRHMDKLELHAAYDRQCSTPEPMSGERADRMAGAVYRLLAERGRTATLSEKDGPFLASCGLGPEETYQVNTMLKVWPMQGLVPPRPERLRAVLAEILPTVEPTATALAQAETIYYRGMAAACFNTGPRWGSTIETDMALLADLDATDAVASSPSVPPAPVVVVAPAPPPVPAPAAAKPETAPDLAVVGLVVLGNELIALKEKKGEWTDKTGNQMRQTAALFVKITGQEAVTQLRQADLAHFANTLLLEFPKGYGQSSRDAAKPIALLLKEARLLPEDERGLEGTTVNRHLTHLGSLIKHARGRGFKPAEDLEFTVLRSRKKGRDRDARPAFKSEQLVTLFEAPIWRGCQSEEDRLEPGSVIVQDALYWVTPIAVYALLRREEICGLMVKDVVFDAPVPYFDIQPNKYRRLKNAQSRRTIPIHPELIRLGLRPYVEAVAKLGYDLLFPELLPASGTAALGDQFYDDWLPALRKAVPGASESGVVFHSIRHHGKDKLTGARVMKEWRQDILGHAGKSEAEERYRDATTLKHMVSALKKLPIVTEQLGHEAVRLRRAVLSRTMKRSRPRQRKPTT